MASYAPHWRLGRRLATSKRSRPRLPFACPSLRARQDSTGLAHPTGSRLGESGGLSVRRRRMTSRRRKTSRLFYSLRKVELFLSHGRNRDFGLLAGVMSFRLKQSEIFYGQPPSVNPRQSVAVLGFAIFPRHAGAWLSTAFSDWLATELSRAINSNGSGKISLA